MHRSYFIGCREFIIPFAARPGLADPIHKFGEEPVEQNRHLINPADEEGAAWLLDQSDDMAREALAADATDWNRSILNAACTYNILVELSA